MNAPNSCTNLKKAIERLAAGKGDAVRLGRALADVTDRRGVLPTVEEAVAWANALVAKIDAATNATSLHAESGEGAKEPAP